MLTVIILVHKRIT